VQDLLQNKNLKLDWQQKRKIMLNDKIDVSKFLTWFIENFPESKQIIENDIEYQFNFK